MSYSAQVQVVPGGPVCGSIRPPGSKSLTNRALICAAFADGGTSTLAGALRSEDTEVMTAALKAIGVKVDVSDGGRTIQIDGRGRQQASAHDQQIDLFIANSGTSVRFLTAALSAVGGHYHLHGVPRMHERPIADLVTAIAPIQQGTIETQSPNGCPPVLVRSDGWSDRHIDVAGSVSSQYLSGLMMAAPIANLRNPTRKVRHINVTGELVSRPYVDMTANVMKSFGAQATLIDRDLDANQSLRLDIGNATYQAVDYKIEPDASAASYFWAAAAITGGDVTVEGLSRDAMQGDVGFCDVLAKMGCDVEYGNDFIRVHGRARRGVDVDMNSISDTVQTLVVVALFAEGPTTVRGVAHNRYKETDRIGDLATELRKLGARVREHEDGMTIDPVAGVHVDSSFAGATLETYHDHRMAMSLSLAGLRIPNVRILDPSCTGKTYPEYFADLEQLIGRPHRWA